MQSQEIVIPNLSYKLSNLDDTHPKSENVTGLNINLMNHQKTAIYHAEILEKNCGFRIDWDNTPYYHSEFNWEDDIEPYRDVYANFGIIGCKVGSGKSFVALSLVIRKPLLNFKRMVSSERSRLCFSFKMMNTENFTVSTNIFLVPHNLFNQWKGYIKSHTSLDTIFIATKKDFVVQEAEMQEYREKKDSENQERRNEILRKYTENKVYLVSSKMWNNFAEVFSTTFRKKVSRIFIDEVHSLSLPNSYPLNANFIWFITSSIKDISNHRNMGFVRDTIDYYWNLGHTYHSYITIKNNDSYVDSSLLLPPPIESIIHCKTSVILNIFAGIINNDVRNMLLAEDVEGVVSYLGITSVAENDIISILCSNLEKELENARLMHNAKLLCHYASEQSKQDAIQRSQEKINAIEEKINNVKQRIIEADIDPIMNVDISNPVITDCCKNKFDLESITAYYEFEERKKGSGSLINCPLCRQKLDIKKLIYLGKPVGKEKEIEVQVDNSERKYEDYTKIENLTYILQHKIASDKKVLIFSEHEGNFSTISEAFTRAGRTNLSPVKGSIAHITSLINRYNNGEIPNLFLNAKYCGSGLNLEKTDVVIIMHRMSEDNIKQVIGRSQRIGRTGQLAVYFLYAQNE